MVSSASEGIRLVRKARKRPSNWRLEARIGQARSAQPSSLLRVEAGTIEPRGGLVASGAGRRAVEGGASGGGRGAAHEPDDGGERTGGGRGDLGAHAVGRAGDRGRADGLWRRRCRVLRRRWRGLETGKRGCRGIGGGEVERRAEEARWCRRALGARQAARVVVFPLLLWCGSRSRRVWRAPARGPEVLGGLLRGPEGCAGSVGAKDECCASGGPAVWRGSPPLQRTGWRPTRPGSRPRLRPRDAPTAWPPSAERGVLELRS